MQSKNKPAPTADEREYIAWIKQQPCIVCNAAGPSEAHEIEQGMWWLSLPLCESCHRGSHNGIHGQRRMWAVMRHTEHSALNETIRRLWVTAISRERRQSSPPQRERQPAEEDMAKKTPAKSPPKKAAKAPAPKPTTPASPTVQPRYQGRSRYG